MIERIIERLVILAALLLLNHWAGVDRADLRVVQQYLAQTEAPCPSPN